jgi:phage tail tape-measure protein
MTKEKLRKFIQDLALDEKFEKLLLQIIEDAKDITPELLTGLADILESYAEYQNNLANTYESIANEVEKAGKLFKELDEKELQEKLEAVNRAQEQALLAINQKIEQIKNQ